MIGGEFEAVGFAAGEGQGGAYRFGARIRSIGDACFRRRSGEEPCSIRGDKHFAIENYGCAEGDVNIGDASLDASNFQEAAKRYVTVVLDRGSAEGETIRSHAQTGDDCAIVSDERFKRARKVEGDDLNRQAVYVNNFLISRAVGIVVDSDRGAADLQGVWNLY